MDERFSQGLQQHIREQGASPALIDSQDRSLSYGDLGRVLSRARGVLEAEGLFPDDVVVSLLPNSIEAMVLFLGSASGGFTYAPISPDSSEREVAAWLDLVKPKICFVAADAAGRWRDVLQKSAARIVELELDGSLLWTENVLEAEWSSAAGKLLLTTSGTTGEPKALVFSVDTLWASGSAFLAIHPQVGASARFLNILPMSYLGGLFNLGLIPLAAGGAVVIAEPFSGRSFLEFWHVVERFEINTLWLVPTIVHGLLKLASYGRREDSRSRASGVRICFLGTAPIEPSVKTEFKTIFGIDLVENFALSETTFLTSETLDDIASGAARSCGKTMPDVELILLPISDEEEESAGVQEIVVRTPYFWLGYLGNDGVIQRPLTDDGYLRTGDVGRLNADDGLLVEGRLRDFVKRGGHFVGLREIELLAEKHPSVAEAAAVGRPHSFYGETVCIFVRTHNMAPDEFDDIAVEDWLRQNLARYKWPDQVVRIDDFPRTRSGKIRKGVLREMAREMAS